MKFLSVRNVLHVHTFRVDAILRQETKRDSFFFLHCLTLMCTLHFFHQVLDPPIYQPLWNFPCQFIVVLEQKHNFNPTELVGIFQVFLSCFDKLNEEKMEMQE